MSEDFEVVSQQISL